MNIIMVQHLGNKKTYTFAVPDKFVKYARKGATLFCDTRRGISPGVAVTGVISGDGAKDIAKRNGATFPLREIVGVRSLIPMSKIVIHERMSKSITSGDKIKKRMDELKKYGAFNTTVTFKDGKLGDGYTAYLVAKMLDMDYIPIMMVMDGEAA